MKSQTRVPIIFALPKHVNLLKNINVIYYINLRLNRLEVSVGNDSRGVKLL